MTIHVVQGNKVFIGSVIYNFSQIRNTILVRFDKPLNNSSDIMVYYDQVLHQWKDDNDIAILYPEVFEQVEFKLKKIMKEALAQSSSFAG